MFCLFLASFFWLLNALSNNYLTELDFDIVYKNYPKEKVILNKLPSTIKIMGRGLGFDLMAYKYKIGADSILIDFAEFSEFESNEKKISTKVFNASITSQLGNKIEVEGIYPETIILKLDEKKERVVRVLPITKITLEKQYQLYGDIDVKPAVVKVSGPKQIIDTLKHVYTEPIIFNDLNKTITQNVSISESFNNSQLSCDPKTVLIHVPVEKFTETTIQVPLSYKNVPDSIMLKAIPNKVEVKFMTPLSKINKIKLENFKAEVDYSMLNSNFNSKLKVELIQYPKLIKSITINPRKVEYILKKRK